METAIQPLDDENPLWFKFEQSIATMLKELDDRSTVEHNRKVDGRLSGVKRQIDVLVRGQVVGHEMVIAVECKRHRRKVSIDTMDAFIGKLIDIGAERGLLYSFGGFTSGAVARAIGASNPKIMAIALDTPTIVQQLHGVPGYPADLLVQDLAPQWVQEVDGDVFRIFLAIGDWTKWYVQPPIPSPSRVSSWRIIRNQFPLRLLCRSTGHSHSLQRELTALPAK